MKITVNAVQFGCSKIVCADRVMAEMLSCSPYFPGGSFQQDAEFHQKEFQSFRQGPSGFFEWLFRSGAKLKVDADRDHFYIYGYSSDGKDTLSAVEELYMLEALRKANFAAEKMNKLLGSYRVLPTLKCSFDLEQAL
jgi:hypothetical protein